MGLDIVLNGIITFIINLYSVISGVFIGLLKIVIDNRYSYENETVSYIGYGIVMLLILLGIIFMLSQIFIFLQRFLEESVGTCLSASLSIALIIEGLGLIFKVVNLNIFSIIAEFVAFTFIFFIIFLIVFNYTSDEQVPRRGR